MHTIEDTLEILAGVAPRSIYIKIDLGERSLIQSLGRQVSKGIALTDRQLDLAIKKVIKYQTALDSNGVDTNRLLLDKPLRMPLREVDRTQQISFDTSLVDGSQKLVVRYTFSKKLEVVWLKVREELIKCNIQYEEDKSRKIITASELSVYYTVKEFLPLNFNIDPDVEEIFKKIEEILETREEHIPYLDFENENFVIRNSSKQCEQALSQEFNTVDENNVVKYLARVKNYEIFEKSKSAEEAINNLNIDSIVKKILTVPANRYLVSAAKYSEVELIQFVESADHWPVLVVLDENQQTFNTLKKYVDAVTPFVPADKINVFFRLTNGQKDCDEFNQYVKDNSLNNYIDEKIKLVFITKDRIPKPLVKSSWKPVTAIVSASHAFGKINAYLNNFQNVYYHNDSIVGSQKNRSIPIAEL